MQWFSLQLLMYNLFRLKTTKYSEKKTSSWKLNSFAAVTEATYIAKHQETFYANYCKTCIQQINNIYNFHLTLLRDIQ